MKFNETNEFQKDFKKLQKKYKSLKEDLNNFKKVISKIPLGTSKHFVILTQRSLVKIIKARFFCRYLKGSSLRVVYSYHNDTDTIEFIEFIELYFKGDKENHDMSRVKNYLLKIPKKSVK